MRVVFLTTSTHKKGAQGDRISLAQVLARDSMTWSQKIIRLNERVIHGHRSIPAFNYDQLIGGANE